MASDSCHGCLQSAAFRAAFWSLKTCAISGHSAPHSGAVSAAKPPQIFAVKQTRGTQDVNDPEPCRGAIHGVVHVLGSASALIGTPVRGGTKRRPAGRAADACNPLRARHV